MRVKCPACRQVIGDSDHFPVEMIAQYHLSFCEATEDEREAALIRTQFEAMTNGLSL